MTDWDYFKHIYKWSRYNHGRIESFIIALRETFKPTPF